MRLSWAALAVAIFLVCAPVLAQQERTLGLDEAFSRAIARHRDLARFRFLRDGAQAELDAATRRPGMSAGVEVDNAPAIGDASSSTAQKSL